MVFLINNIKSSSFYLYNEIFYLIYVLINVYFKLIIIYNGFLICMLLFC